MPSELRHIVQPQYNSCMAFFPRPLLHSATTSSWPPIAIHLYLAAVWGTKAAWVQENDRYFTLQDSGVCIYPNAWSLQLWMWLSQNIHRWWIKHKSMCTWKIHMEWMFGEYQNNCFINMLLGLFWIILQLFLNSYAQDEFAVYTERLCFPPAATSKSACGALIRFIVFGQLHAAVMQRTNLKLDIKEFGMNFRNPCWVLWGCLSIPVYLLLPRGVWHF